MNITEQKKTDKTWNDETGAAIPFNRVRASERLREARAARLAKQALSISNSMKDFKENVRKTSEVIITAVRREMEKEAKAAKGNYSWYNFDRSIKVEVSVNERIDFDEMLIGLCKEKLMAFVTATLSDKETFIVEMVNDAFNTTKGKLDAKKVMSLLKYEKKIKAVQFQEALSLLKDSIRRPESKTYFRVWVKDENGEYKNIELNFSAI